MPNHKLFQRAAVKLTARGLQLSRKTLGLFEDIIGN